MPLSCSNGHVWIDAERTRPGGAELGEATCPICSEPLAVQVEGGARLDATNPIAPALDHLDQRTLPLLESDSVPTAAWPQIPGYEIRRQLGAGGMGTVYLARDLRLHRSVALKVIRQEQGSESELRRFEAEAESIARLRHPNIVQIYGFGDAHGTPYLSLEYVEGGSLASRLQAGPLSFHNAATACMKLAEAVDVAHRGGIVHRDLKPSNVLLTPEGDPKITDFGLAKQLDADSNLTQSGALAGTPRYMSPEQAAGGFRTLTPASDIFSLGAILYETITGTAPFRGDSMFDLLAQVCNDDPIPPRRLNPKLPRDLETICLRALEKQPNRRYATALAMSEDLKHFLNGEPIAARAVGPVERAAKWVRRRPTLAGTLVASALVVVFGIGWATSRHYGRKLSLAYDDVDRRRVEAETFRAEADRQRSLAQRVLYCAHMNQAYRAYREGQARRMEDLLAQHQSDVDLHGFEWRLLQRFRRLGWRELTRFPGEAHAACIDANGRRLAATGRPNRLEIWDLQRMQKSKAFTLPGGAGPAAIDPTGSLVACSISGYSIRLIDANVGAVRGDLRGHPEWVVLAFSPDGARLASVGPDRSLRLWDVAAMKSLYAISTGIADSLQFSLDGKHLLAATRDRKLKLIDVASGKIVREFASPERTIAGATFLDNDRLVASASTDGNLRIWRTGDGVPLTSAREADNNGCIAADRGGKRIATGGWGGAVRLWDSSGNCVQLLGAHGAKVNQLAFGPQGKSLYSSSFDGSVRVWDLEAIECTELRGQSNSAVHLAFTPDGKSLVASGMDAKGTAITVWDLNSTTERLRFQNADAVAQATTIAVAPTGDWIAAGGFDCVVRLWSCRDGKSLAMFSGHAGDVTSIAISPDGRQLASSSGDHSVRIWSVDSQKQLAELRKHPNWVKVATYSEDGALLATGCHSGVLCIWAAATGELQKTWRCLNQNVAALAFVPGSHRLASVGSHAAVIWQFDGEPHGEPRIAGRFAGHNGPIMDLAFSPTGDRVATTGWDRCVKIWDVQSGQEILSLGGLANTGTDVAFSPDGAMLAVADGTSIVRLWRTNP